MLAVSVVALEVSEPDGEIVSDIALLDFESEVVTETVIEADCMSDIDAECRSEKESFVSESVTGLWLALLREPVAETVADAKVRLRVTV